MVNKVKNPWVLLGIVAAIVTLFTIMFFIATQTKKVDLSLIEGERVSVKLFRFGPQNISLDLRFSTKKGSQRPELGSYTTKIGWEQTRILDFPNPGEPVKVLISDTQQEHIYEARPAGSYAIETIGRGLVPYHEDNNSNQFPMDFADNQRFMLHSGFNEFQVTVLEVGKPLLGEQVTLYIKPSLSFKFIPQEPFYKFLWYFNFWPIYFLILFVWFFALVRNRKIAKSE
jgi:hypothetical protein